MPGLNSSDLVISPPTEDLNQYQTLAADALQRPLVPRSRFRAQLKAGVRQHQRYVGVQQAKLSQATATIGRDTLLAIADEAGFRHAGESAEAMNAIGIENASEHL